MTPANFLRHALPTHVDAFRAATDMRMAKAANDTALSSICTDIEAALNVEHAPAATWRTFEELKVHHVRRMFAGARAG